MFRIPSMLNDADTGWHLTAGEWIFSHRSLPVTDLYSWTAGNHPWLNISWMWDISASWVWQYAGLYGLGVITALLLALIITTILGLARARDASLLVIIFLSMAGLPHLMATVLIRPQLATLLLLSLVMLFWHLWLTQRLAYHWLLIATGVIALLWVNMHGGFIALFTVIGAYGAQALWQRQWQLMWQIAGCGLLCAAALLLNPLGFGIFEACWRTLGGPLTANIVEWKALSFSTDDRVHLIYPMICLACLIPGGSRLQLAEKLLAGFWLAMAVSSLRHLPVFFILTLPMLASLITSLLRDSRSSFAARFLAKSSEYEFDMGRRGVRKTCLFFSLAVIMITPVALRYSHYSNGVDFPLKKTPRAELAAIESYRCLRLFNHYNLGGWIIYETKGKWPVFMDGRAETAYPIRVIEDYLAVEKLKPKAKEILAKYDVQLAMIPLEIEYLQTWFSAMPEWQELMRGEVAVVYIRRDAKEKPCP